MKQVLLVLSLSGLALCGSLSNEYLPASAGIVTDSTARSFGPHTGGSISTYSPSSRFASSGNLFGSSSVPSPQYGVPGTAGVRSQIGGQYPAPTQYNRPAAPAPIYGAPSQNVGVSSFRSSSPFSSGPSAQYGAPFKTSGVSGFGSSAPFSSGAQFKSQGVPSGQYGAPSTQYGSPSTQYGAPSTQYGAPSTQYGAPSTQYGAPSTQYGAPSAFGQQRNIGVGSSPSYYSSSIGQSRGISTQYGAPQQYQPAQFGQSSFRSGPQFGGVPSFQQGGVSAHRPAAGYSGTVQDADGAYFY